MNGPITDDQIKPVALAMLGCVCAALAQTPNGPVCACCLRHAQDVPTLEQCLCECHAGGQGEAWVRVAEVVPGSTQATGRRGGGVINASGEACGGLGIPLTVTLELGVARCIDNGDEQGNPPSCATRQAEAMGLLDDLHALRHAYLCCAGPAVPATGFRLVRARPWGPEGGCAGWVVLVSFELGDVACCDSEYGAA